MQDERYRALPFRGTGLSFGVISSRQWPVGHEPRGSALFHQGYEGHVLAGEHMDGPIGWHGRELTLYPTEGLNYDDLYGDIQRWEGVVRYMYLDTARPARVTVGTGNMLPNIAAAQSLPFVNTGTRQAATKAEIAAAFNAVAAMQGGLKATHYKQHPTICITEEKAKELALDRLKHEFVPGLRRLFSW